MNSRGPKPHVLVLCLVPCDIIINGTANKDQGDQKCAKHSSYNTSYGTQLILGHGITEMSNTIPTSLYSRDVSMKDKMAKQ